MNVRKVILPIGSCHRLVNKAEHLIRLHLEKISNFGDTDGVHDETLSVAVRIYDPDCSPFNIQS